MQLNHRWMIIGLILGSLQLSGCAQTSAPTAAKVEPAHVKAIEGTELNHVILTAEAAKRLDIQTVAARTEQITRKRSVGGEVVAQPSAAISGAPSGNASSTATDRNVADETRVVWVRVPLSAGDLQTVDRSQPATILPLVRSSDTTGVTARPVDSAAIADTKERSSTLYYAVEGTQQRLTPGQRVRVQLTLMGQGSQRAVIPYSAVIYDLKGETWVYTSPEALTFVRERITVDYIEGDQAILTQGPAAGTKIVSVGAAELFGTEFGVGH